MCGAGGAIAIWPMPKYLRVNLSGASLGKPSGDGGDLLGDGGDLLGDEY